MSINKDSRLDNHGFAHLGLAIIILIVFVGIGFAFWRVQSSNSSDSKSVNDGSSQQGQSGNDVSASAVEWSWGGTSWMSSSTPPACKEPIRFSQAPIPSSSVGGILYPGQVRGGNFKPHGGFKLNTGSNNVDVKAIYDGTVVEGARYIEGGEVQYMFTVVNDCGIAYRYDHLLELSPTFGDIAESLPEPKENDSRTTKIAKGVKVKAGNTIATAVGFKKTGNNTFDLGVYDYRKQNDAAKKGSLEQNNLPDMSQAGYALCWLNMFEGVNYTSYPAVDGTSGKSSTYCPS